MDPQECNNKLASYDSWLASPGEGPSQIFRLFQVLMCRTESAPQQPPC